MKKLNYVIWLIALIFMSCGDIKKNDDKNTEEWMQDSSIAKITEQSPVIAYAFDEFGIYDKELSTDWGGVKYRILVNHHHTGAVIIDTINCCGTNYVVYEGYDQNYNGYLTNACANLRMHCISTQRGATAIGSIFGSDRNPLYRQVFHMAETAIIKDRNN